LFETWGWWLEGRAGEKMGYVWVGGGGWGIWGGVDGCMGAWEGGKEMEDARALMG